MKEVRCGNAIASRAWTLESKSKRGPQVTNTLTWLSALHAWTSSAAASISAMATRTLLVGASMKMRTAWPGLSLLPRDSSSSRGVDEKLISSMAFFCPLFCSLVCRALLVFNGNFGQIVEAIGNRAVGSKAVGEATIILFCWFWCWCLVLLLGSCPDFLSLLPAPHQGVLMRRPLRGSGRGGRNTQAPVPLGS